MAAGGGGGGRQTEELANKQFFHLVILPFIFVKLFC